MLSQQLDNLQLHLILSLEELRHCQFLKSDMRTTKKIGVWHKSAQLLPGIFCLHFPIYPNTKKYEIMSSRRLKDWMVLL